MGVWLQEDNLPEGVSRVDSTVDVREVLVPLSPNWTTPVPQIPHPVTSLDETSVPSTPCKVRKRGGILNSKVSKTDPDPYNP